MYMYVHVHIYITCILRRKKATAPAAADSMVRAREEYTFFRCCFVALLLQQIYRAAYKIYCHAYMYTVAIVFLYSAIIPDSGHFLE